MIRRLPVVAAVSACAALPVALAVALVAAPSTAEACGGMFCDATQPVNQAAERIIFTDNPDGTVTAVVQILYQGEADRFGWLLPVPGIPSFGISSNTAFSRLQAATNPTYRLNTIVEGECDPEPPPELGGGGMDAGSVSDASGDADPGNGGVTVLDSGTVGPYDYVVLELDETLPDIADLALDWLTGNNYQVTSTAPDLIRPYLEDGMNLLAIRLTKNADTGEIRPVILNYESDIPMIPIKLTAVAANDDMGVMVWVGGAERAVPVNYRALELNETLINWFNPAPTYNDVVIAAANESGGQGFVTEMAETADSFADLVLPEWQRDDQLSILADDWTDREGELLDRLMSASQDLNSFSGPVFWDGVNDVLGRHLAVPEGVDEDDFYSCIFCYLHWSVTDIAGLDPATLLGDWDTTVWQPMVDTQEILDSVDWVTRMYTTLSAAEMTVDPVFDFNPDLETYSNNHTRDRIIECEPGYTQREAPWRVEFDSGYVVRGQFNTWPLDLSSGIPANSRILAMTTSGEGEVITDNTGTIAELIVQQAPDIIPPNQVNPENGGEGLIAAGGCSECSATHAGNAPLGSIAFVAGLFLIRRRRRGPGASGEL